VIVTADHGHNLYGPESDVIAFQDVSRNCEGDLSGHIRHDDNHGNQLVPAWVRSANAGRLTHMIDGYDPVQGWYIDLTDLGNLMKKSLGQKYRTCAIIRDHSLIAHVAS